MKAPASARPVLGMKDGRGYACGALKGGHSAPVAIRRGVGRVAARTGEGLCGYWKGGFVELWKSLSLTTRGETGA